MGFKAFLQESINDRLIIKCISMQMARHVTFYRIADVPASITDQQLGKLIQQSFKRQHFDSYLTHHSNRDITVTYVIDLWWYLERVDNDSDFSTVASELLRDATWVDFVDEVENSICGNDFEG